VEKWEIRRPLEEISPLHINALTYIAFETLGPSLLEGYIIYERLDNIKKERIKSYVNINLLKF